MKFTTGDLATIIWVLLCFAMFYASHTIRDGYLFRFLLATFITTIFVTSLRKLVWSLLTDVRAYLKKRFG